MKKTTGIGFLALVLSLSACQESATDFQRQYYDVAATINGIVKTNSAEKTTYVKEAWINGDKETVEISDVDWKKELEVFLLADLNKRDYLNKYAKDSSANKIIYKLLPDLEAPVNSLEIDFKDRQPSGLTAVLKTDNFLYESERILKLSMLNGQLSSYEVNGWQELFIGDKKTYRLRVTKKGA